MSHTVLATNGIVSQTQTPSHRDRVLALLKTGTAVSTRDSIQALWRFSRLDGHTVECASMDCGQYDPGHRGKPLTKIGYARSVDEMLALVRRETHGTGYYMVPAIARQDALARYPYDCDWHPAQKEAAVKESEVVHSRVLAIDLDTFKARKANASSAEVFHAGVVGMQVKDLLLQLGVPESALAMGLSGNGFHVLLALDIAWSVELKALRETVLGCLSALFSGGWGKVDTVLADGARYIPIYGTLKRKGADLPELNRPQRKTFLVAPETVTPLDLARFTALVDQLKGQLSQEQLESISSSKKKTGSQATKSSGGDREDTLGKCNAVDVATVARLLGIDPDAPQCPACGAESGIDCLTSKGQNIIKCLHATCGERVWSPVALVAKVEAGVDDLTGNKDAVRTVIEWFVDKGLVEAPAENRAKSTWSDKELQRLTAITKAESEAVGIGIEEVGESPYASDWEASLEAACSVSATEVFGLHDIGNSQRLVKYVGQRAAYVPHWASWMVYNEGTWQEDKKDLAMRASAESAIAKIPKEAALADASERAAYKSWYTKSSSEGRVLAAVNLAKHRLVSSPSEFVSNPRMLNVANGVVNLETGELLEHAPRHKMTHMINVEYDPRADTTLVDTFFAKSQPDPEVRAYLWRLLGYSISGVVADHVIALHYGKGRNGKGTLIQAISTMMGSLATPVPDEVLTVGAKGQHPTSIATLFNKRFAVASEIQAGSMLNAAMVKRLTGGDLITARGMRQDFYTFAPTHHIHMLINDRPKVPNAADSAIWDRLHMIPWTVVVPVEERILGLQDRLAKDPGLLRRVVEGAVAYFCDGLQPPEIIRVSTSDYQRDEDRYADWIDECVEVDPGGTVTVQALYESWVKWAEKRGMRNEAYNTFSKALELRNVGSKCMGGPRKKTAARAGVRLAGVVVDDLTDIDMHLAAGVVTPPSDAELDAEEWADRQVLFERVTLN